MVVSSSVGAPTPPDNVSVFALVEWTSGGQVECLYSFGFKWDSGFPGARGGHPP